MSDYIPLSSEEELNQTLNRYAELPPTSRTLSELRYYLYQFFREEPKPYKIKGTPKIYFAIILALSQEKEEHALPIVRKVYEEIHVQFFANPYAILSARTRSYNCLETLLLTLKENFPDLRADEEAALSLGDQKFQGMLKEGLNKLKNYQNFFPLIDVFFKLDTSNGLVTHFNEDLKKFELSAAEYYDRPKIRNRLFKQLKQYMQSCILHVKNLPKMEANANVYLLLQSLIDYYDYNDERDRLSIKVICDLVIKGLGDDDKYYVKYALFFNNQRLKVINFLQNLNESDTSQFELDKEFSEKAIKKIEKCYKKWGLTKQEISIEDDSPFLGEGTYSHISRGILRKQGRHAKEVAVKNLTKHEEPNCWFEIYVLTQLQHPYIIPFLGFYNGTTQRSGNASFYLIFDLMKYDLETVIFSDQEISQETRERWLKQIAAAIYYLHEKKIIHSDIKLKNTLSDGKDAFLSDFGGAFHESEQRQEYCSTRKYRSKELMINPRNSFASDIYAYGCLAYESCTRSPFNPVANEIASEIQNNLIPDDVPSDIREIIEGCWRNQASRLSAIEVVRIFSLFSHAEPGPNSNTVENTLLALNQN